MILIDYQKASRVSNRSESMESDENFFDRFESIKSESIEFDERLPIYVDPANRNEPH